MTGIQSVEQSLSKPLIVNQNYFLSHFVVLSNITQAFQPNRTLSPITWIFFLDNEKQYLHTTLIFKLKY